MVAIVLVGRRGIPATAGFRAAAGRLPHDPGADVLSRRQPRRDGFVGDRALGAAVRPGAGTGPDDVDQLRRELGHHLAVRAVARHRRGRAAGAGGDQRRDDLPSHRPAESADLQQDQSGRRADSHAGAQLRDVAAAQGRRPRGNAAGPEDRAADGRGHGQHQRRPEAGRPRPRQSGRTVVAGAQPRRSAKRHRGGKRQPGEREFRRTSPGLHDRGQRPAFDGGPISEAGDCLSSDRSDHAHRRRASRRRRRKREASRLDGTSRRERRETDLQSGRRDEHSAAAGCQHYRGRRPHQTALAAAADAVCRPP